MCFTVGDIDHLVCSSVVVTSRFLACCWHCSFLACCWHCSFLACCWHCSFLACCWHCSFLACCWHCSFLACCWPCVTLFLFSIIHHVVLVLSVLLRACPSRPAWRSWSAGLTSTTVFFLHALRVKGSPSSSIALVSRPRRSLALANGLSMTSIVLRVLCFGVRDVSHRSSSSSAAARCVWPCASWSVGTSRHRHARFDRPVSVSDGASHLWSTHQVCSCLTVRSRFSVVSPIVGSFCHAVSTPFSRSLSERPWLTSGWFVSIFAHAVINSRCSGCCQTLCMIACSSTNWTFTLSESAGWLPDVRSEGPWGCTWSLVTCSCTCCASALTAHGTTHSFFMTSCEIDSRHDVVTKLLPWTCLATCFTWTAINSSIFETGTLIPSASAVPNSCSFVTPRSVQCLQFRAISSGATMRRNGGLFCLISPITQFLLLNSLATRFRLHRRQDHQLCWALLLQGIWFWRRGRRASSRLWGLDPRHPGFSGVHDFLSGLQLWDLNCLLRDLHNKIIDRLINTLHLWSLSGLLNSRDHGDLSLHTDGHFINLVKELVSLHCQLDDFRLLHFDCVDDVLNVRVRNLLRPFWRLNDRHLNDHLNEWSRRGFTWLYPPNAVESRRGENSWRPLPVPSTPGNWNVNNLLHSPHCHAAGLGTIFTWHALQSHVLRAPERLFFIGVDVQAWIIHGHVPDEVPQNPMLGDTLSLVTAPYRWKLLTSFSIDLDPLQFDDVALHVLEVWHADTRLHWERLLFLIRSRGTVLVSSELNPCASNGHSMPLCPLGSRLSLP